MSMTQIDAADVYGRQLLHVLRLLARGDFSVRLPLSECGLQGEISSAFNDCVEMLQHIVGETNRVSAAGKEGKLSTRARVKGTGMWATCLDNLNGFVEDVASPVRETERVLKAIASGNLSRKVSYEIDGEPLRGEFLRLAMTTNELIDQLGARLDELNCLAIEGTGGHAELTPAPGSEQGVWGRLASNICSTNTTLMQQIRTAQETLVTLAQGDFSIRTPLNGRGEVLILQKSINELSEQLDLIASGVTRVIVQIGEEGLLGNKVAYEGAKARWAQLIDGVNMLSHLLSKQVREIAEVATAVTSGQLTRSITYPAQGDMARVKNNINEMIYTLRKTIEQNNEEAWVKANLASFSQLLQGQRDFSAVAELVLSRLTPIVNAQQGVIHVIDLESKDLRLVAGYGVVPGTQACRSSMSLTARCVEEKRSILIKDVPAGYLKISSALGEGVPSHILLQPIVFEGQVTAVMELASFSSFSDVHLRFIDQLTETIGIVLNNISASLRTEELLKQSQLLAGELIGTNKRLEEQASNLRESESLLQLQREELQHANAELKDKALQLSYQNFEVARQNKQIDHARLALEDKAGQLARNSRYKSEFLANMSHELRTPLNSLLILSQLLAENLEGNLNEKQIEFAQTIHASGTDLLNLINEILDLSKIESGTITLELADIPLFEVICSIEKSFRHLAESRGLEFDISSDLDQTLEIYCDGKRLYQVLRNLVSNAIKFTESGQVTVEIAEATGGWSEEHPILSCCNGVIAFAVKDTGIGIPAEKHRLIFEAFHQADGTTSRRFGGTGLGLSISRELAALLGGEITVASAAARGSVFTLYVPRVFVEHPQPQEHAGQRTVELHHRKGLVHNDKPAGKIFTDDRDAITAGDRVILLVEDDPAFAMFLMDQTRQQGFKVLIAENGEKAFSLASRFCPQAITLDINLPDVDGWSLLSRLKHDARTCHIPVQVISVDEQRAKGLRLGALGYLQKPVTRESLHEAIIELNGFLSRPRKRLLVVASDQRECRELLALINAEDIESCAVSSGGEAMKALASSRFDCVVLDAVLPDTTASKLIRRMRRELQLEDLPVVILNREEAIDGATPVLPSAPAGATICDVSSAGQLLAETATYLHRCNENLDDETRKIILEARSKDARLKGKRALIIDDDARNIFALTSVLERQSMSVLFAETGMEALDILQQQELDIILVDIMMPNMDGYEVIRRIRSLPALSGMPVIALTANAMAGDRDRCLKSGASDYISKPVDTDKLMSLLRAWLST